MSDKNELVKAELEEALGILISGDITSVVYDMLKDTYSLKSLITYLGGRPKRVKKKKELNENVVKQENNSLEALFANSPVIGGIKWLY